MTELYQTLGKHTHAACVLKSIIKEVPWITCISRGLGFPNIDKTILIQIFIRCANSFWYLCLICDVIQVFLYLLLHSGFVTLKHIKSNMQESVSLCLLVRDQQNHFFFFGSFHVILQFPSQRCSLDLPHVFSWSVLTSICIICSAVGWLAWLCF